MTLLKKTLALLLCLAMALSIVACGGEEADPPVDLDAIEETLAEGDKDCNHVWGDWEEEVASSCTTDGLTIRTCETCGKQESEKLPAYGHDVSSGKCMECGKKIKKCDHEDTDIVVIKAATCTEKGKENEVCSECFTILDEDKIPALGHSMVYHEYKDPDCTNNGWYSYEACENCGLNDKEEIPAYGHNMSAGTCTVCAYVDSTFEIITAPGMTEVSTTITAPESVSYDATAATVYAETHTFTAEGETKTYQLTAAVQGYYRLWFTEVYSGNKLDLYVYNSLGERIKYDTWMGNNGGITVELNAGEVYTIEVKQRNGLAYFQLNVGCQKVLVDVSGYDVINDSIQFGDQAVVYEFTPTVEGSYRFQFSNMMADMKVDIYMYNYLNERVNYETYCNNGSGFTVTNLVANQTYKIIVYERSNLGNYTLSIYKPLAATDISNYNTVYDSIRFNDQVNTYTFTANSTSCTLFVNGMDIDEYVSLYLYNYLGETVNYETYCVNGEGFNLTNLTVGQVYTIKVEECSSDMTNYALRLYTGKDPVDVSSNMAVIDTMEFEGQVNTYILTVDQEGEHEILMATTDNSYDCLTVAVYDSNGTLIGEDYYMYAGDYFSLGNLTVGSQYTIVVTEYDTCGYTLAIQ